MYIEYGTTDKEIIEIQNLGFQRNTAIFLKENYMCIFEKNNKGSIINFDEEKLKTIIDKEKHKHDYEDLADFLC